jgi:hypothetical protein
LGPYNIAVDWLEELDTLVVEGFVQGNAEGIVVADSIVKEAFAVDWQHSSSKHKEI